MVSAIIGGKKGNGGILAIIFIALLLLFMISPAIVVWLGSTVSGMLVALVKGIISGLG